MAWKNTHARYGTISIALHWLMLPADAGTPQLR